MNTIINNSVYEYEIKKSKFITVLYKINTIDEVNKYYLTAKLNYDWEKEVKWQYKKSIDI